MNHYWLYKRVKARKGYSYSLSQHFRLMTLQGQPWMSWSFPGLEPSAKYHHWKTSNETYLHLSNLMLTYLWYKDLAHWGQTSRCHVLWNPLPVHLMNNLARSFIRWTGRGFENEIYLLSTRMINGYKQETYIRPSLFKLFIKGCGNSRYAISVLNYLTFRNTRPAVED